MKYYFVVTKLVRCKMRSYKMLGLILTYMTAGWLAFSQPAFGEEQKKYEKFEEVQDMKSESLEDKFPVEFSLNQAFYTKYMCRGFIWGENPVLQTTLSASYENFSIIGFANFDNLDREINETDFMLDYTNSFGDLILSLGYAYYDFPNTDMPKTQEVYVGVSLETVLKPSLTAVYDFDDGSGWYVEAAIGHDFTQIPISTNAKLGFNHYYYRDSSGFSHIELSLALPMQMTKQITFTPNISYSKSQDPDDFEDTLYGGVTLEFVF